MMKFRSNRFALVVLIAVVCSTYMAPAALARGRGDPTLIIIIPAAPPPPPAGVS